MSTASTPAQSPEKDARSHLRRRRGRLLLTALACQLITTHAGSDSQAPLERPTTPSAAARSPVATVGFAPIGDVQMYYEIHGSGEPVLFIHGGGGSSRTSWPDDYVNVLSRDFMVILADSRGQGNSTEGEGPITYGRLAFDAVKLLDHLGIARAHIVGHSSGGVAALFLLVHFPDRVRTATLLGALYHVDNYRAGEYEKMKRDLEASIRGDNKQGRMASTPVSVLKKFYSAWLSGPGFTLKELETIGRPTLIVKAGQDSFMGPEIADTMHAHIRRSELITFPHASHRVQVTNSKELVAAIRDFMSRRGRE